MWHIAAWAGLLAMLGAPALADTPEPVLVQAAGATRTIECNNRVLQIEGARNVITATGHCAGLKLRGDSNAVSLPLTGMASIDIEGSRNRVRYTAQTGTIVQLRLSGDGTEVLPGPYAPAPSAAMASISGNGLNLDLDCEGLAFTFNSIGSAVALRGQCKAVMLHGEANLLRVDLAAGASVQVQGNANTVLYRVTPGDALPGGSVDGMGSLVAEDTGLPAQLGAGVPPAKLAVPLLVRLLDAQVQEPGTLVHLPAAIFTTDSVSTAGALQLNRLGGLLLQAWPSGVRIVGHAGNEAAGRALAGKVSNYLIEHGVPGLSAQIGGDAGDGSVDVWLLK